MKTVVYQSYRTTNVSKWIQRCMDTVKSWTASRGFDYRFFDDELIQRVPEWFREKVNHQIQPIMDLARLQLAKEFLAEEFERTIWIDADVVIFDPEAFEIAVTEGYAFCREVWIEKLNPLTAARRGFREFRLDGIYCRERVNNAVCVFTRSNSMLDFYLHAAEQIVKHKKRLSHLDVSTFFLTDLNNQFPLSLLTNVGLISPHLMQELANGGGKLLETYTQQFAHPIHAANLCASYANKEYEGVTVADATYDQIVDQLIQTRGQAFV